MTFSLFSLTRPALRGFCAALAVASSAMAVECEIPRAFFVDLSPRPDVLSLAAFDLNILNAQAEVDLEPGHAAGNRFLAMLNVAELRAKTFQEKEARDAMLEATTAEEIWKVLVKLTKKTIP